MSRKPEPDPVEWVREHWVAQDLPEADRFMAAASVMRMHQVVVASFERALRNFEISRTMYLVLVTLTLSPEGSRRLSYLTRYLMVHQTTITQVVDQLEKRGLVRREPHPTDRRATLAVLTPAGRALCGAATAALAEAGFGMAGVDRGTLRTLIESLREARCAVGDL